MPTPPILWLMSRATASIKKLRQSLIIWYLDNCRPLPWRANKDPYHIWLSEVMLQQTTVRAVIPYYEKFLLHFPKVQDLASATPEQVNALWSGLGYYSRARNLHAAAKKFAETGFPRTARELLEFPGFGPYTANAVASFAFDEAVGVLDGNVIRLLSRQFGLDVEWWMPKGRKILQEISDQLALGETPDILNQGLIELGALVCTPQNPACLTCPWQSTCVALAEGKVSALPRKRIRRDLEIWKWDVALANKSGQLPLVKNASGPFLKNSWIFPGAFTKVKKAPEDFSVRHSITHHDIFVSIETKKGLKALDSTIDYRWVEPQEISQINPSSLLKKVLMAASLSIGINFTGCKSPSKSATEQKVITTAVPQGNSSAKQNFDPKTAEAKSAESPSGTQITQVGINTSPSWSPDGQKFLFVSEARVQHKQKQIYEYSLATNKESRVVYLDGTAESPFYWNDGNNIAFLSDTDSLKENPVLLRKNGPSKDPLEMFIYGLSPLEIKKVGSPSDSFLKLSNSKRRSSPSGRQVWLTDSALHWSDHRGAKVFKNIDVSATDLDELSIGSIRQDEIILFSGLSMADKRRQIYAYWPDSDILFMPIPTRHFNFSRPRISPVSGRLLFISDQTGKSQIFLTTIGGMNN